MPEDKKIIIDEDWKSQVEAEKEAAAGKAGSAADSPAAGAAAGESTAGESTAGESTAGESTAGESTAGESTAGESTASRSEPDDVPMPPATLEMLVSSLVTEALIALGQIPHPATGKTQLRKHQAKYLIDTVDVLREKTQGNITKEEEQFFEQLLHQLRMAFVSLTTPGSADSPPS